MNDWVECVPNFSEGRNPEVLQALAAALTSIEGVFLLDQEQDASHNRSVFTIAGPPQAVRQAAFAAIRTARDLIDLNRHKGEHPRIGSTDVVPFVPLGRVSVETCVALARDLGRQVWEELGIPVYFYEEAATREERRDLAGLRRGEFEGLREEVRIRPERHPDIGGPGLHPTAGATVIGVRHFLIAFNAYLSTPDVRIAKEIAKAIRHSSGGFRYVKAMGFFIQERHQAQVSMNLVNFRGTPIQRVVESIRREAQRFGVQLVSTEIVGLVPREALEMASEYYLQLERFSSDQILENKIHKAIESVSEPTLKGFLNDLALPLPTPGGGSAAALAGALAGALGSMVADLTLGKEKFKAFHETLHPKILDFQNLRQHLFRLIEEDAQAYRQVVDAYRLAKATDEEKTLRQEAVRAALEKATQVPLETARAAVDLLECLWAIRESINPNALSDLGVGAQLAVAAAKGGLFNVRINLSSLPEGEFRSRCRAEAGELWQRLQQLGNAIEECVLARLSG